MSPPRLTPATPPSPPSPDPGAGSGDSTRPSRPPRTRGSAQGSATTSAPSSGSARSSESAPASESASAPAPESGPAPAASDGDAPISASPQPGAPAPDPVTTAAVQTALGAEHAAVWCYGLVEAFLPDNLDQRAQEDLTAHRARRDLTVRLLADYGVTPEPAEPAYRTPVPVTDQDSAMRLVVTAETDAAAAWHSLLERCDDRGLRRMALDGLTDAALRGARWSAQLGSTPVVPDFPGRD